ncbi:Intermediate cleaving peptidase 55 [Purpureocillium takamizusanense]|uniref:Xaa-Pro aminopeptidase n=1 Tax=Purpureocillium takamizusanense TaxID=2060973 RepID=A0A9Q8QEU8_9HYPO|nr:Intermediate cleaving peptidase 55 [Purpureocillium takamizusanense]UNI18208.1 Intermediate cleaving peptidase 55 [Purpureocillium takamizusanense]
MSLSRPPFRSGSQFPLRLLTSSRATSSASTRLHTSSRSTAKSRPSHATAPASRRAFASVSAADLKFGQPVYETHPHILKPGEITPGITAQEYADRRAALADAMTDGSVAVLHAAPLQYKSGAVFHPYRQESNFLWLTGWNEPDAVAIIEKTGPNRGDYIFRMFVKRKDPREEQWSGYRNGIEAAEDIFNADEAGSVDSVETVLPQILGAARLVYADTQGSQSAHTGSLWKFLAGRDAGPSKTPLYPVMNKLRVVKSPAEVANMRKAGQISGRAITEAMRQPWAQEKHLHAFLDYQLSINGCDGPAYIPVVAGGERANCIHYTVNNATLREDEFILVDAGGEYGTYITDISRTWPASGKFSAAQRDLYEAVLRVQRSSVSLCRESAHMSLEDIHGVTARGLVDQLRAIGFDVSMSSIDQLFPHHVGHYIGLDVHDCPGFSRREVLRRGHCVTIEPGVYVPDDERWPAQFRGMGVRIEDSICVDDDSPYILTTEAVKEVDDIEALRS